MKSARAGQPGNVSIGFLIELKPGAVREPPVGNIEQIETFAKFGVWLRPLAVHRLISSHEVGEEITPTFVANVVGAYQQIGMFYEDIISTSAAWGAINRDRNLLIADILEKVVVLPQKEKQQEGRLYHELIFERLSSKEPCLSG